MVGVAFRVLGLLFQVIELAGEVNYALGRASGAFFRAGLERFYEFLAHVGQAADVDDPLALAQGVVAGEAVGLEIALEIADEFLGHLSGSAGA